MNRRAQAAKENSKSFDGAVPIIFSFGGNCSVGNSREQKAPHQEASLTHRLLCSIFSFHLRQHHINCLKNGNVDRNFSSRELPGILFLFLTHLPIWFLSPMFYSALLLYGVLFVIVHNTAHIWPKTGRKLFPWHWDHHMRYQNHNFNVVLPIADYVFGTRKK